MYGGANATEQMRQVQQGSMAVVPAYISTFMFNIYYIYDIIEQSSLLLLNGACMNNIDKSNSDVIKSGVPSSMRTCHKYNIM